MSHKLRERAIFVAVCTVMPGGFFVLGCAIGRALWKSYKRTDEQCIENIT